MMSTEFNHGDRIAPADKHRVIEEAKTSQSVSIRDDFAHLEDADLVAKHRSEEAHIDTFVYNDTARVVSHFKWDPTEASTD